MALLFAPALLGQSGPGGVSSGITYWFRADANTSSTDNGAAISTWLDASGQGDTARASGASRPTYVSSDAGINNQPCLDFNGSQQLRIENYLGNSNEGMTFVALFQVSTPATEVDVVHQHGGRNTFGYRGPSLSNASRIMNYVGGSLHVGNSTTPASTWISYATTFDTVGGSGSGRMYRNDSLHSSYSYTIEFRQDTSFIGGPGQGGGTRLEGRVAELAKFSRVINALERRLISNAWNAKYGISLPSGTDKYAGDELGNGNYDMDVIGVAMDTIDGVTYNATSAVSQGGLTLTRSSGFETGDYVLIGHAGGSNGTNTSDIASDTTLEGRWQRDWYVDVTDANTTAAVDLVWDFSDVGSDLAPDSVQNYVLIQRAGRTGAWTVVGVADAIVDDQVHFNGVSITADGYYTMGSLRLSDSPLPIELLDFRASPEGESVRLEWTTATESNNRFFEVQRSSDAQSWITLGYLDGAGNSSTRTDYAYLDHKPETGRNYYRLWQEDFDGTRSVSPVASAWVAKALDELRVWPIPTTDVLNVSWNGHQSWTAFLLHSNGRIRRLPEAQGSNALRFDVSDLPHGVYILRMQNGVAVRTRRVVVGP